MATYDIYLEINEAGNCYAHVPALPGCMVRGRVRDSVVAILPQTIRADIERLMTRGLMDESPDGIELNIVETHSDSGSFDPGDSTALLGVDKAPLTENYLGWFLMHSAENRKDLLALVEPLPDEILDWTGWEVGMSIRRVLWHIGRSEQWYLSRITDTVASEPEPDNVFDFLAAVRQSTNQQINQLTEDQRSAVFQPAHGTTNPDEQWTSRKALRRLLEHEREHIGHIEQILDNWRRHYLVRLTAERADLIWQLISFGEETLAQVPVFDNYTAKDLLAHIPAWDDYHAERISLAQAGRVSEIVKVDSGQRNEVLYPARKNWSLSQAVDACLESRRRFEESIAQLPDPLFHRPFTLTDGTEWSIRDSAEWRFWHDATHSADLAQWREANQAARTTGPKSVLLAALETAHEEMLAVVDLIPEAERETRLVCGEWTLKDVLGHVADWEWYGVEKWRPEQSNRSLQIAFPGTIQEWNDLHAAARKEDSWERVWVDYTNARSALRQIIEEMDEEALAQPDAAPWNPNSTVYRWILIWIHHEREHAADLRKVLNLPDFPERLTHA